MNNQLHHLWNDTRDRSRGSDAETKETSGDLDQNRLTLRKVNTDTSKRST